MENNVDCHGYVYYGCHIDPSVYLQYLKILERCRIQGRTNSQYAISECSFMTDNSQWTAIPAADQWDPWRRKYAILV
jgi:hypothetical protein